MNDHRGHRPRRVTEWENKSSVAQPRSLLRLLLTRMSYGVLIKAFLSRFGERASVVFVEILNHVVGLRWTKLNVFIDRAMRGPAVTSSVCNFIITVYLSVQLAVALTQLWLTKGYEMVYFLHSPNYLKGYFSLPFQYHVFCC